MSADLTRGSPEHRTSPRPHSLYLGISVFFCGASVLMYELLAARFLAPYFGSGIDAFTAVLSAALIALALGYWLGGILVDRFLSVGLYCLLLGGAAVLFLFQTWALHPLLALCVSLGPRIGVVLAANALLLPPLILLGMITPFAIRLGFEDPERVGRKAGSVFGLSTLGSVLSTMACGWLVVPMLGALATVRIFAGMLAVISVWGLLLHHRRRLALIVSGTLLVGILMPGAGAPGVRSDLSVLHREESSYGEILVLEDDFSRYLLVDGILQGELPHLLEAVTRRGDLLRAGNHLELLPHLRPRGRRALFIGLGAGVMPRVFAHLYGWSVEAVEIDRDVIDAARDFFGYCAGPVWPDDGRAFLERQDADRLDFVVLDVYRGASIPAHLYTVEAFRAMRRALGPDGVLAVHHVGERDGPDTGMLHRTLTAVFPHVALYAEPTDPKLVPAAWLIASAEELRIREPLPAALTPATWEATRAGPILTDDRNPLELLRLSSSSRWRTAARQRFR